MFDFNWFSTGNALSKKLNRLLEKAEDIIIERAVHKLADMCPGVRAVMAKPLQLLHRARPTLMLINLLLGATMGVIGSGNNDNNKSTPVISWAKENTIIQIGDKYVIEIPDSLPPTDVDSILHADAKHSSITGDEEVRVIVPPGKTRSVWLPDKTLVTVNAKSFFRFPIRFRPGTRDVYLDEGEIYLEVAKDESRLFTVHTKQMDIIALGTTFNVNNYPDNENMEVTLQQGNVLVTRKTDKLLLEPGKAAVLNRRKDTLSEEKVNTNVAFAWLQNRYIFVDKTLEEICHTASRACNEKIIIDKPGLAQKRFFCTFNKNTPVERFLEFLHDNDGINYSKNKNGEWHLF
jgi:hypothetical protein